MTKLLVRIAPAAALVLAAALPATPAMAALAVGARAPDFAAQGALAGKTISFTLKNALKKGPVVLYFYPKAFTSGCTQEAHAFAESMDKFQASGATVIGMSADDIPTLQKFSTAECRDKFAVAAATPQVIKAYDVAFKAVGVGLGFTKRTSYVIAPDGRIVMVHDDMDWRNHVKLSLAAVQKFKR